MRRRDFVAAAGLAALTPKAGVAQSPIIPVLGIFSLTPTPNRTIFAGLKESGYVEGGNLAIKFISADSHYERLPSLAAALVAQRVNVILTQGGEGPALAAQRATKSIPIVFVIGTDPVKLGLVASMNRPGANVTGVAMLVVSLVSKRVELLHELRPAAKALGLLVNPNTVAVETEIADGERVAAATGHTLVVARAARAEEIERAFEELSGKAVGALAVSAEPLFTVNRVRIIALAARYGIPAVYSWVEYVEAGGLMTYGPDLADVYRQGGLYAGRILRGEKPADLPVVQPTKYLLRINLQTAKALGLAIPPTVLARADEVIE